MDQLSFLHLRSGRLNLVAVNSEVRAVHAAEIAAAALVRRNHVRRMIAFGIKGRRKREDLGGTEFHAETAGLAALNDDGYASFCHEYPHKQGLGAPVVQSALWSRYGQRGVMGITEACEIERAQKGLKTRAPGLDLRRMVPLLPQFSLCKELAYDGGHVAMLPIHGIIQPTHIFIGNLAG